MNTELQKIKTKIDSQLEAFARSYMGTAEWTRFDSGEPRRGFGKAAKEKAKDQCRKFVYKVFGEFSTQEAEAILDRPGSDLDYLWPHELWLTQNGHGAGFWDNGKNWDDYAQDGADRLTKLAKEMGGVDIYVGAGGWICLD
jgi:hypothetical protein